MSDAQRRFCLGALPRLCLAGVIFGLALTVAVSCQDRGSNGKPGAEGAAAPTPVVAAPSPLRKPEGRATLPAGTAPNGQPLAQWVKALGFTYAAAPPTAEKRSDEQVVAMNKTCVSCHTVYRP